MSGSSFVQAEDVLDGIHNGRVAVEVAIEVNLLLILVHCFKLMIVLLRLPL